MRIALLAFVGMSSLAAPAAAIEVDGVISPGEWDGARHVTDFRLTQPLSREPAPHPTEAWILATPEGLAIGWRNTQPASVPRTRQRAQRDQGGSADRVNLYVDFDGDGRTGYNFTLLLSGSITDTTITNENQFNSDWDGDWRRATSEDSDTWSAEMLLPWHIAPMRAPEGDMRTIGVSLDRVIGVTGQRMSWPAIGYNEQRFLSVLEKIQVPRYSESLLAVTPYVVGLGDLVAGGADFDAGADVFWKPNGQFQLSATLNPDFGQVESDNLVVNFGAIESFFSDRRPFFTENQGFFDVPFGGLGNANRLLYTRRVGGPADDGSGAGDVTAAAKVNGSFGDTHYGLFAASEGGAAGRDFQAARVARDIGAHGIGAMVTRVERPFLDREAMVYAADHRWGNDQWSIRTTAVLSSVVDDGQRVDDSGVQVRIDRDHGNGWRQQLYLLHLGDRLQLNDFGFLERNDYNYARYDLARRITDLPEASSYASHDWHFAVSRRENDSGLHIADAWAIQRRSERRDGGNEFFEVGGWTSGYDDLITRGNGPVKLPERVFLFGERFRPRGDGQWALYGNLRYFAEGLEGGDRGAVSAYLEPTWHASDTLSFNAGLELQHDPDWLLWQHDNLVGTYRSDMVFANAGVTWLVDTKQELRVRLEALGLDARAIQPWRVQPDGTPVTVDEPLEDFALRNLGFQVRYRYELAPLSYLYVAYVRGGSLYEQGPGPFDGAGRLLAEAFDLRDSEQLLVKLSYRFEI